MVYSRQVQSAIILLSEAPTMHNTLERHQSDLLHWQIIRMHWATSLLVLFTKLMAKIQVSTSTLSKLNILLLSQLASKVLVYPQISMAR